MSSESFTPSADNKLDLTSEQKEEAVLAVEAETHTSLDNLKNILEDGKVSQVEADSLKNIPDTVKSQGMLKNVFDKISGGRSVEDILSRLSFEKGIKGITRTLRLAMALVLITVPVFAEGSKESVPKEKGGIEKVKGGIHPSEYIANYNEIVSKFSGNKMDEFVLDKFNIASKKDVERAVEVLRENKVRIKVRGDNIYFAGWDNQGYKKSNIYSQGWEEEFMGRLISHANEYSDDDKNYKKNEIYGMPDNFRFLVTGRNGTMTEDDLVASGNRLKAIVAKQREYVGKVDKSKFKEGDAELVEERMKLLESISKALLGELESENRSKVALDTDGFRYKLEDGCHNIMKDVQNIYYNNVK